MQTQSVKIRLFLLALGAWVACGFSFFHKKEQASTSPPPRVAEPPALGYALLYKLMGDEKDVSKILIIKRNTSELHDVIKAIARRCGSAHDFLEEAGKKDSTLNLKEDGLPQIETTTREAISKSKAKLLLTDKGSDFELLLLMSQNEALTYATKLAESIAKGEQDPNRMEFLRQLAQDADQLNSRVLQILFSHYR